VRDNVPSGATAARWAWRYSAAGRADVEDTEIRLERQEHVLRIGLALEAHDEVVRVARSQCDREPGDDAMVDPVIEDVLQEDAGKELS
jgi:hypothetical protein